MAYRGQVDQPKLTIVGAHRVSTLILADAIIVLEDRAIVERGTHYRPRLSRNIQRVIISVQRY